MSPTTFSTIDAMAVKVNSTFTTMDAVVGPFSTWTSMDAVIKSLDRSTFTTLDAKVARRTFTSMDALVSDARGYYRGVVSTTTDRDALPNLKAGDIVDVQAGASGAAERHHRTNELGVAVSQNTGILNDAVGPNTQSAAYGQSFQVVEAITAVAIDVYIQFLTGTPADSILVELLTTSMTGTVIATSATRLASSLTARAFNRFTLGTPVSLVTVTDYFIRITRTGAVDVANYVNIGGATNNPYAAGQQYRLNIATWQAVPTEDLRFQVISSILGWAVAVYHEETMTTAARLKTIAQDATGSYVWRTDASSTPTKENI